MSDPPFALDGTVSREKLQELLAVQTELAWLDLKASCDLSGSQGLVELAKDVGAMSINGGYLIVGADDSGTVVGLSPDQARLFDEATLSAKLAKYLPPGFHVRSALHDLGDADTPQVVAVVWVQPHPDGWCVFTRNGDYPEAGKVKTAFRVGEVYARHGTRSEPWQQADIAVARTRLMQREKDTWRAEHADETRRALQAALAGAAATQQPTASFSWQLDANGYEAAVIELLRRNDDVPLRRMLRTALADAETLVMRGEADEFAVVLDRVATLAALAMDLDRPTLEELATHALLDVFDWAIASPDNQSPGSLPTSLVALRLADRLYALGALAVRLKLWATVRRLVVAPLSSLADESRSRTWHRFVITQASWAGLLHETVDGRTQDLSLLMFARATASRIAPLRPDVPVVSATVGDYDPLLTSLTQFDFLVSVVTVVATGAQEVKDLFAVAYPSFARFFGSRVMPAASLLLRPEVRAALVPGAQDEQLARVMRLVDTAAAKVGQMYDGWEGYTDEAVQRFIDAHDPAK